MIKAGATLPELQDRLGHNSLATTGIYARVFTGAKNPHANKLAELFGIELTKGFIMTTHEQRLSALERTQIANNEQFTMLLGVIGEQGQDIKRMLNVLEQHTGYTGAPYYRTG